MNATPDRPNRWSLWPTFLLPAAAMLPLAAPVASPGARAAAPVATEWPRTWDGEPLRPMAPTVVEARFAHQFPGRIGRFDAGRFVLVLREVREPTRLLHPASDCYRGLGYAIEHERIEQDAQARTWRCFVAVRDGHAVRICERIEGRDDTAFTDTSAWFWAATLGRTQGPWHAVTRVERP